MNNIIARFEALTDEERCAFEVMAVFDAPITLTMIKRAVRHLGYRSVNDFTVDWKNRMIGQRLLSETGWRNIIEADVRIVLSQRLALEDRYQSIYDAVHALFDDEIPEESKERACLYTGNWEKLRKLSFFRGKPWRREFPPSDAFTDFEAYLDERWLETLPADIRWRVLMVACGALYWGNQSAPPLDVGVIVQQLNAFPDTAENQVKACLLAEIDLWRGDVQSAESRMALREDAQAWALRGRLALMRGDVKLADSNFRQALDKAKTADLTSLDCVLMAFCWLADRQYSRFRAYIDSLNKKCRYPVARSTLNWLRSIADHLQMQENLTTGMIRGHLQGIRCAAVPALITVLSLDALDIDFSATVRREVTRTSVGFCENALMNSLFADYYWLSWQLICWLERKDAKAWKKLRKTIPQAISEDPDSIASISKAMQAADYVPANKWIKKEEPWERSLQALLALQDSPTEQQQGDQRLIWIVSTHKEGKHIMVDDIEPRLQRRLKSGAWGAARVIRLERLGSEEIRRRDFPFLSSQDQKMCQGIIQEEGSYWRYYRPEWGINLIKILSHAGGHPLLFLHDLHTPLRVDKEDIVLHVNTENDYIRICLYPSLADGYALSNDEGEAVLFLAWETPQHLKLYSLTPELIKLHEILGNKGLRVPADARERALQGIAAIAPLLNIHSDIGGGSQGAAEKVANDNRLYIRLQPVGDGLQVSALVQPFGEQAPLRMNPTEGAISVFTEVEDKVLQTHRDLKREQARAQKLFQLCPKLDAEEGWHWQLDDPETAFSTLEGLQQLAADEDAVLEWPEGKALRVGKKVDARDMKVSMRKQQDWFSVEGEVEVAEGQVVGIQQLMSLMDQSPGRFVKLGDEQFINLSESLYQRLNALKSVTDDGRFHQLAAGAVNELTEEMTVRQNAHWKKHLQQLQNARDYQPVLPSTLKAELRDYQREGFIWMARLAHWGAGACLADDMGLGKTVQALALILLHASKGPALVVAPTSVCMNWEDEAARFAPTLNVHVFGAADDRTAMISNAGAFDLVVCSYALLQRQGELLASREWQTVVLDEAQAIKNSMTKRSQAAMSLTASVRLITTGTPIENHLGELWTLFNFINPGLLGGLDSFTRRFANPIQVQEDEEVAGRLRQLIHPFILRRLKRDVLTELPPRTETTIHVELSSEELALYEAARRRALENIQQASSDGNPSSQRIRILAEIMRLRRACCHPSLIMPDTTITGAKLTAFGETLGELRENGHKALVFSQFVDHLSILRQYLDDKGISYQYLDGSTPAAQRKKRVNAFQNGEGDVFLISLKAGGAGLNLTAADYVLHMDPWWNPAVEDQASDRAHRMGQKRPVTIYRFIAKNTIEDKIIQLHHRKRDLADALLEGSDTAGALSLDEIRDLVASAGED